ncbi:hypothetical protein D3C75_1080090 [compost metagenome]
MKLPAGDEDQLAFMNRYHPVVHEVYALSFCEIVQLGQLMAVGPGHGGDTLAFHVLDAEPFFFYIIFGTYAAHAIHESPHLFRSVTVIIE